MTATVDVGTFGGNVYTRETDVPPRSDTKLVTSYEYNSAGWLEFILRPREVTSVPLKDKYFYDDLGRVTKTIEAWTGDLDADRTTQTNRTTEYTYDGSDHILMMTARLPGSNVFQTTEYVYDTAAVSGSDLVSKDLLTKIKYPKKDDPNGGTPDENEKEQFTYNALSELKTAKDRNLTTHTYSYDVMGRLISDSVAVGASVDSAILRLGYSFDSASRPYEFTSYDAASGGNIKNQVRRIYNGFGQLTTEYQEHNGTVSTGTSPKVQYAYQSASNSSRRTSMTYPSNSTNYGKVNYNYTEIGGNINRVGSLSDANFAPVEEYSYLGLNTIVKARHPLATGSMDLTYIGTGPGEGGDQYVGLDRFGRIVEQRWDHNGDATDLWTHGYDRSGNRMYSDNQEGTPGYNGFDELYHADGATEGYDNLDRLKEFRRGTFSGSTHTITNATRTQTWTLEALGNWDYLAQTGGGSNEDRDHNRQNQIKTISGQTSPLHDNNGSMTRDQTGRTLTYDAWNRLKTVVTLSNPPTYHYDALGRRIRESVPDGGGGGGQSFTFGGDDGGGATIDTDFYYSDKWQVIEERVANILTAQYIWSERYVDAMVMRHRNFTGTGGAPLERFYVQTDVNYNVTALFNATSQPPAVVERYVYDPNGQRTAKTPTWGPRMVNGIYSFKNGFQGKRYESNTGLYHFNFRDYSPSLGRFVQADPLEYLDGMNRQQFVGSNPVNWVDPLGLKRAEPGDREDQERLKEELMGGVKENEHEKARKRGREDLAAEAAGLNAGLDELTKQTAKEAGTGLLGGAAAVGIKLAVRVGRLGLKLIGLGKAADKAVDATKAAAAADDVKAAVGALRPGRQAHVKVVRSESELAGLFDDLTVGGTEIPPGTYPGKVIRLPDGTVIRNRPTSRSTGASTIDITYPDGTGRIIHIDPSTS